MPPRRLLLAVRVRFAKVSVANDPFFPFTKGKAEMGGEVPPETEQDEKTSSVDSRDDVENQKPSVDTSSIESSIAAAAAVSSESNFHQKQQDAYVKKGTRVALLLKTALRSMAEGLVVPNEPEQNSKKRSLEGCTDHKRRKKDFAHAEQIALEKEEECNTLRRVRFFKLLLLRHL